ncbi:MAG: hypothetical protein AB7I96_10935 [Candidatus Dadabacteria bacterium]
MKNSITVKFGILAFLLLASFMATQPRPSHAADEILYLGGMLPDITSPVGIEIAGERGYWGDAVRLNADDASYTEDGKCVFSYGIELVNSGSAPAGEFSYRLNAGGWSAIVDEDGIGEGGSVTSVGEITLSPGRQKIAIKLDNHESVAELDELNNVPFALRVEVDGDCDKDRENPQLVADSGDK